MDDTTIINEIEILMADYLRLLSRESPFAARAAQIACISLKNAIQAALHKSEVHVEHPQEVGNGQQ